MAVKIITFLSIFVINIAVGAAFVLMLMFSLNGFGERDANYAFAIFIAGGLLISVLASAGGVFLFKFLSNRQWNGVVAVLLSIAAFTVLGIILKTGIFFVSVLAADFARRAR
jgi:hypothetical protein